MKRIVMVLMVAALVAVALMGSAGPAFADKPCGPWGCAEDVAKGECVSFLATTEEVLPIGGGEFSSEPGEYARAHRPIQSGHTPGVGCPKDTLPPPPS